MDIKDAMFAPSDRKFAYETLFDRDIYCTAISWQASGNILNQFTQDNTIAAAFANVFCKTSFSSTSIFGHLFHLVHEVVALRPVNILISNFLRTFDFPFACIP